MRAQRPIAVISNMPRYNRPAVRSACPFFNQHEFQVQGQIINLNLRLSTLNQ